MANSIPQNPTNHYQVMTTNIPTTECEASNKSVQVSSRDSEIVGSTSYSVKNDQQEKKKRKTRIPRQQKQQRKEPVIESYSIDSDEGEIIESGDEEAYDSMLRFGDSRDEEIKHGHIDDSLVTNTEDFYDEDSDEDFNVGKSTNRKKYYNGKTTATKHVRSKMIKKGRSVPVSVTKSSGMSSVVTKARNQRVLTKNGEEQFICEKCGEVFTSGWALGGHASRVHPGMSAAY